MAHESCPRCQGLMVIEPAFDVQENSPDAMIWRCIQCGNRLDATIESNRRLVHPEFQLLPFRRAARRQAAKKPA